jgi:cbb3-type cytochrome oxidase subunit 3
MAGMRRCAASAATVALAIIALAVLASPARAAAYRYWTYWTADAGTWRFSSTGPSFRIPADGTVEGWRFAVSTTAGEDAPRVAPSFEAICGATAPQDGRKRVALVIDPGDASSAPEGQAPPPPVATCVVADADATGYDVLRSEASVRTDDGLICAISEYPTGECAPSVDASPAPPATATSTPLAPSVVASSAPADEGSVGGTPLATLAVGGVLIGVVAYLVTRGRRRHDDHA